MPGCAQDLRLERLIRGVGWVCRGLPGLTVVKGNREQGEAEFGREEL